MSPSEVTELAPYVEKASRVELIVRWFYGIAIGLVFFLWELWINVCTVIHFWYILFSGRRSPYFYRQTRRYIAAVANAYSYLTYLTDGRPDLTPDLVLYARGAESDAPKSVSSSSARFCVSCGAEIPVMAAFCPKCGASQ